MNECTRPRAVAFALDFMADTTEKKRSPSPARRGSRSPARSPRRSSRSPSKTGSASAKVEADNRGNNLYIAGLSIRTTERELERKFEKYGKVLDCRLVLDPRTKESRGFGFVTMETSEQATDAVRGLDRAEVDGRVISVEKAKRNRPRTPTPGQYLGNDRARRNRYEPGRTEDRRYDERRHDDRYDDRRSPRGRSRSPRRSPYRGRSRSPRRSPPRYRN